MFYLFLIEFKLIITEAILLVLDLRINPSRRLKIFIFRIKKVFPIFNCG